jgi:hypothetical protein
MKRLVIVSFMLVGLVGCGPRFGGGSSGSYANADGETTTEVVTQRDQRGQLLFVVAWASKHGGGSTERSGRSLLTSIHGRAVHPNLERRAVYALQGDGSLRQISLSDGQIAQLFQEMERPGFHAAHSDFWQKAVAPQLIKVEVPSGS